MAFQTKILSARKLKCIAVFQVELLNSNLHQFVVYGSGRQPAGLVFSSLNQKQFQQYQKGCHLHTFHANHTLMFQKMCLLNTKCEIKLTVKLSKYNSEKQMR